jgi:hypothetical protein
MTAIRILATMALMVGAASAASAQTATQTVTFQVDAINQIAFSGSPSLVINTATAGTDPSAATAAATWAVTTNQSGAKVTASIGSAMPAGVTLSVNLAAPTGATSAGAQALGTTADAGRDLHLVGHRGRRRGLVHLAHRDLHHHRRRLTGVE